MHSKRFLVVVNGELPGALALQQLSAAAKKIICTDGAALSLVRSGVLPDVVIGDLDSLDDETRALLPSSCEVIHEPSQYATDFEKALSFATRAGADTLSLTGLKGGRFDHQFTNVSVIKQHAQNFYIEVYDPDGYGYLLSERQTNVVLEGLSPGTIVSLLPLNLVEGVTTEGLLYPLNSQPLHFGFINGQSNEVVGTGRVSVSIRQGVLLVYVVGRWVMTN